MSEDNREWPDSELPETFDWSLSLREIDKRHLPLQIKAKEKYRPPAGQDEDILATAKPSAKAYVNKLASKYPHVYELLVSVNEDLPRWIYDNLIAKSAIILTSVLLLSCGPSRNPQGQYWKTNQVWRRITAGRSKPVDHQLECPKP